MSQLDAGQSARPREELKYSKSTTMTPATTSPAEGEMHPWETENRKEIKAFRSSRDHATSINGVK